MKLQKVRKTLLITALLLFPITMWYFSPYLIIQAVSEHVMNGSFIVFALMFICSMFLGRVFCGYLCPMGGLQECVMLINDKHPKQGWKNNIKYIIWTVWMASIYGNRFKAWSVAASSTDSCKSKKRELYLL